MVFILNLAILTPSGVPKSPLGDFYLLYMVEVDTIVTIPVDQQKSS